MKCQSTDNDKKHLTPPSLNKGRPLSISSVSSAASSNSSSSSANSSASSGVQSSLTRNGSLNYGHEFRKWAYLASIDSLDDSNSTARDTLSVEIAMKELNVSPLSRFKDSAAARAAALAAGAQSRGFGTVGGCSGNVGVGVGANAAPLSSRCPKPSTKLQPSPSSVSSHSNNSSLFRDDGFEDDITSTASEHAPSTAYNQHHRLSFQSRSGQRYRHNRHHQYRHHSRRTEDDEDEYQSCEEELSNSQTTASTASNIDDCALSTTSSSIIQHEHQVLDKISLAQAKQQYRKSLLLEHQQQQYLLNSQHQSQTKIQALISTPPQIPHFGITPQNPSANTNAVSNNGCTSPSKQSKCDDRTVNIIGHMPTKSPGYWDSNLSIAQRVVTEIIETERTYVDDLEQIVTGYICYLRNVLKQRKQQQHQQRKEQYQSKVSDSNLMVNGRTTATTDDDKSMFVFNDYATSAANEVDDYDVEEAENDLSIRENILPDVKHLSDTKSETSEGAIMTATHIKRLFSNLEDIYKFNKDLLFRLEECYLNPSSVAECFVENASGFEIYTHYCTTYPQVVSTLTELMSNQTSAQSLRERQNDLNQSLPLGAYLLKPVQRILKYHILFQSLIKHTTDDETVGEKDRQLINEAFSVMTNIACHINTMKKRHEHAIRVQEVQGLLCGWEVSFLYSYSRYHPV